MAEDYSTKAKFRPDGYVSWIHMIHTHLHIYMCTQKYIFAVITQKQFFVKGKRLTWSEEKPEYQKNIFVTAPQLNLSWLL